MLSIHMFYSDSKCITAIHCTRPLAIEVRGKTATICPYVIIVIAMLLLSPIQLRDLTESIGVLYGIYLDSWFSFQVIGMGSG